MFCISQLVPYPSNYVQQAKNYLRSHDVTAEEADQIIVHINNAQAVVTARGAKSMNQLTKADKLAILAELTDLVRRLHHGPPLCWGVFSVVNSRPGSQLRSVKIARRKNPGKPPSPRHRGLGRSHSMRTVSRSQAASCGLSGFYGHGYRRRPHSDSVWGSGPFRL